MRLYISLFVEWHDFSSTLKFFCTYLAYIYLCHAWIDHMLVVSSAVLYLLTYLLNNNSNFFPYIFIFGFFRKKFHPFSLSAHNNSFCGENAFLSYKQYFGIMHTKHEQTLFCILKEKCKYFKKGCVVWCDVKKVLLFCMYYGVGSIEWFLSAG